MAVRRLCALKLILGIASITTIQPKLSVFGLYQVEVSIQSYNNPTNGCSDCSGGCCDNFSTNVCTGSRRCDNVFRYCLRLLYTPQTTRGCSGGVTSEVNHDGASIDFSKTTVLGLPNPITLRGRTRSWQGVQLYTEVIDADSSGSDELVDSMSINIYGGSPVGKTWVVNNSSNRSTYGFATIGLTVRVVCFEHYYGDRCQNYNVCTAAPIECSGNGRCVDGWSTYHCVCDTGFTGLMCETNIDDCVGVNCSRNGQCVDRVNNFTCVCQSGFTGDLCELDTAMSSDSKVPPSNPLVLVGGLTGSMAIVLVLITMVVTVVFIVVSKKVSWAGRRVTIQGSIHIDSTSNDNIYEATNRSTTASPRPNTSEDCEREIDNPMYGFQEIRLRPPPTGRATTKLYTTEVENPLHDENKHAERDNDIDSNDEQTVEIDNPLYGEIDVKYTATPAGSTYPTNTKRSRSGQEEATDPGGSDDNTNSSSLGYEFDNPIYGETFTPSSTNI